MRKWKNSSDSIDYNPDDTSRNNTEDKITYGNRKSRRNMS